MTIDKFEDSISELTETQKSAAFWNEGSLLVLAGPGSGKTRVLTTRIARILRSTTGESFRVLALTFTNKAADEMIRRLEDMVPVEDRRFFVGTFHSFCTDVLRQHGTHVGVKPSFRIYDDSDRKAILAECAPDLLGVQDKLLAYLDRLRGNLITPEKALSRPTIKKIVIDAYSDYHQKLSDLNALDFPAIILFTCELFERFPAIAKRYRKLYKFWCVDEFQDTNYSQYQLLKLLANSEFGNVFVVADDDQIIYQWNGADHQRIEKFADDFRSQIMQLPTNYRCPSEIVQLANNLIQFNKFRMKNKAPLQSAKPSVKDGNQSIALLRFATDESECDGIASRIAALGPDYSRTLALARTRKLLLRLQQSLQKKNIRAEISQRRDDFASAPFAWLHACLRQANDRLNARNIEIVAGQFDRMAGIDTNLLGFVDTAVATNVDYLSAWLTEVGKSTNNENMRRLLTEVEENLVSKVDYKGFVRRSIKCFDGFFEQTCTDHSNATIDEFKDDRRLWSDMFRDIITTLGESAPLDAFLQEVALRSKEPQLSDDVVRLMTIHAAKGTGFDHVFLIGLAEDQLPSFLALKSGPSSKEVEEERRNCYVAITRTKETLTLSFADQYNGYSKKPSRFLAEMGLKIPSATQQ